MMSHYFVCIIAMTVVQFSKVSGHGYICDPPGRSSMWRKECGGFSTPTNVNDMGLNCGGLEVQFNGVNQGRCGECGDEWSLPRPRSNDEGGLYGTGVIGKTYRQGSVINATVLLTANHYGFFTFRLCPKTSAQQLVTQQCLDQYLLTLSDGSTKFPIQTLGVYFYPKIQLPPGLTCNNCVLQWRYTAGNNWGICEDGTGAVGCGDYQETFVNCADIAIV
ncbi:hypothetical protein GHT06_019174 [Daphnia sinensis]|uniref:Chitin-binding type-4 domain-containing protein n=1 Tax=Daphnia sinensis TaxID=1820382 RepID=A0AAD5PR44_9CRUS|nr:hypothetical protein GHT06_019174 [Daphnia sinensis]